MRLYKIEPIKIVSKRVWFASGDVFFFLWVAKFRGIKKSCGIRIDICRLRSSLIYVNLYLAPRDSYYIYKSDGTHVYVRIATFVYRCLRICFRAFNFFLLLTVSVVESQRRRYGIFISFCGMTFLTILVKLLFLEFTRNWREFCFRL